MGAIDAHVAATLPVGKSAHEHTCAVLSGLAGYKYTAALRESVVKQVPAPLPAVGAPAVVLPRIPIETVQTFKLPPVASPSDAYRVFFYGGPESPPLDRLLFDWRLVGIADARGDDGAAVCMAITRLKRFVEPLVARAAARKGDKQSMRDSVGEVLHVEEKSFAESGLSWAVYRDRV